MRACQKALAAAGAPEAGARAAAWLEARGLRALPAFAADLQDGALRPSPVRPRRGEDGETICRLRGKSLAVLAPHLLDYLISRLRQEEIPRAVFADARSPVFLLFAAQLWTRTGAAFFFADGKSRAALCVPEEIYLANFNFAPGSKQNIAALCAADAAAGKRAARLAYPRFFSVARRIAAGDEQEALNNNLNPDLAAWRTIGRYAARVLVPPSARSRRQAGA